MTKLLFVFIFSSVVYWLAYLPVIMTGTIPGVEQRLGGSYTETGIVVTDSPVTILDMPSARGYIVEAVAVNNRGEVIFIKENLISGQTYIAGESLMIRLNGGVLQAKSLDGVWTISISILWV